MVYGRSEPVETDTEVFNLDGNLREFLCTAADLILAAVAAEPQRGDIITDADGVVWHVTKDAWRWSDRHRKMYRIFASLKSGQ